MGIRRSEYISPAPGVIHPELMDYQIQDQSTQEVQVPGDLPIDDARHTKKKKKRKKRRKSRSY